MFHPVCDRQPAHAHAELEAELVDLVAEPDHAVRVPVSVDGQRAVCTAEAGGVAAVEIDIPESQCRSRATDRAKVRPEPQRPPTR